MSASVYLVTSQDPERMGAWGNTCNRGTGLAASNILYTFLKTSWYPSLWLK